MRVFENKSESSGVRNSEVNRDLCVYVMLLLMRPTVMMPRTPPSRKKERKKEQRTQQHSQLYGSVRYDIRIVARGRRRRVLLIQSVSHNCNVYKLFVFVKDVGKTVTSVERCIKILSFLLAGCAMCVTVVAR